MSNVVYKNQVFDKEGVDGAKQLCIELADALTLSRVRNLDAGSVLELKHTFLAIAEVFELLGLMVERHGPEEY